MKVLCEMQLGDIHAHFKEINSCLLLTGYLGFEFLEKIKRNPIFVSECFEACQQSGINQGSHIKS